MDEAPSPFLWSLPPLFWSGSTFDTRLSPWLCVLQPSTAPGQKSQAVELNTRSSRERMVSPGGFSSLPIPQVSR